MKKFNFILFLFVVLAVHFLNGLDFLRSDFDVGFISLGPLAIPLIAAGAKVLSSAVGGALNNAATNKANRFQLQMQREQNQFNLDQWNRERAFTEEMWNRENEYNTASAQRKRLEDAGLNPSLMLNGGNAGIASSASTPAGFAAAPAFQPRIPDYSYIADMVDSAASAFGSALDLKSKNLDNQMKETQAQYQEMQILKSLEKLSEDTANVRADTRRKAQEATNLIVDEQLKRAQLKAQDWTNEHLDRNFNMQVQEFNSNMATADILRQMNIKQNDRAERVAVAQIKSFLASAYQASQTGNYYALEKEVSKMRKNFVENQAKSEGEHYKQEHERTIKMPEILRSEIEKNLKSSRSGIDVGIEYWFNKISEGLGVIDAENRASSYSGERSSPVR